jgi:hypothetical protein
MKLAIFRVGKKTGGQKFQTIRNINEVAVFDEVNESTAINIDDQIKIMIDGGNNEL